jgi:hypothetical protein
LLEYLRRDAPDAAASELLDVVLVDSHAQYATPLDLTALRRLGVEVVDVALARADDPQLLDSDRVAEALLSFV